MATATSVGSISVDSCKAHSAAENQSSHIALYALLLALVTGLAIILRLHALTAKSFWLDEGVSVEMARMPFLQFLHAMWSGDADTNMALYLLLLRFWLIMGGSEGWIRGLSVLFSVATVPFTFFLGARLFGRRAGLLAALLLSINAYRIRYAQEARGYAMVVFFAVLATWLLARNLQAPSSAHWGIYALACALATYSHSLGALLVPAHAISLLSLHRDEIPWRKFLGSLLWFSAMLAPVAIYVLKSGASPISWVPPLQPDSLLILGVDFSGAYGTALLILDVLAMGIAALRASRAQRASAHASEAWGYALVFSWLFTPVVTVLAVSLVKSVFVPRYLSFCLPALLILVAVGISLLRPAALSWALFLAISIYSISADIRYYKYDFEMRRQDWRAVTSYIFDRAQPGDSIFFCDPGGEAPFEYYSRQQKSASLRPKTLHSDLLKLGSGQNPPDLNSDGLVNVPGTNLRIAPPAGSRVWLVLMFLNGSIQEEVRGEAVGTWLSNGRRQVDTPDFSPLKVVLFERAASNSPSTSDPSPADKQKNAIGTIDRSSWTIVD